MALSNRIDKISGEGFTLSFSNLLVAMPGADDPTSVWLQEYVAYRHIAREPILESKKISPEQLEELRREFTHLVSIITSTITSTPTHTVSAENYFRTAACVRERLWQGIRHFALGSE